ncbi:hypothetical protein FLAPXU55_01818 [Flavobacterium panici]|uniref:Uncharacterized protein n=1 Tax=Flavobacterium panici TaxID=2654843 RepID=A0A9N8J0S0_9FLAO|nr:hypothetical protein FLAPXU55_01818 [Flavobacterium panici]
MFLVWYLNVILLIQNYIILILLFYILHDKFIKILTFFQIHLVEMIVFCTNELKINRLFENPFCLILIL